MNEPQPTSGSLNHPKPKVVSIRNAPQKGKKPVVLRKGPGTDSTPIIKASPQRTILKHSKYLSGPKMGKPDFSSSIISENQATQLHKKSRASSTPVVFFDAAVASVAISFLVLTLTKL